MALVTGAPIRASSVILDAQEATVLEDRAPMDERTEDTAVIAADVAAQRLHQWQRSSSLSPQFTMALPAVLQ